MLMCSLQPGAKNIRGAPVNGAPAPQEADRWFSLPFLQTSSQSGGLRSPLMAEVQQQVFPGD